MRPLPEAARAIVESARDAHDPSEAQVQNMLTKLHAQLGYAPAPSEPAQTPHPVAGGIEGARGLLHAKLLKLALSIAAIGGMTALVVPQLWKSDVTRPSPAALVAPATPEQPSAPSADALQAAPSASSPEKAQDDGAQNAAPGKALSQEDDSPEQETRGSAPRATARTGAVAQRSAASPRTTRVNLPSRETSRTVAGTARSARRSASDEASSVGAVFATERSARRSASSEASSVGAIGAAARGARRSASSEASSVGAVAAAELSDTARGQGVGAGASERGASSETARAGAERTGVGAGASERGASSETARAGAERTGVGAGASERGASSETARAGAERTGVGAGASERGASSETADKGAERSRSDDAVRTLAALDSGSVSAAVVGAPASAASEKVLLSDDVVPVQTARKRVEEKAHAASDADELALIDRAASLLRDGEPERALGLLQEHGRKFPASQLTLERRGLSVLARCNAGQIEQGRRERDEFLRDAGKAPIAARVRRACPEPQR